MNDDPIVASVRCVRAELAAKFNYDVRAIFSDMRSRESQADVSFVNRISRTRRCTRAAVARFLTRVNHLPAR